LGILPDAVVWGQGPVLGHIGGESFITRRDVWLEHCHAFGSGRYESDYDFLAAVWQTRPVVVWLDRLLVRCLRVSRGQGE
jgi:hypothetical protein